MPTPKRKAVYAYCWGSGILGFGSILPPGALSIAIQMPEESPERFTAVVSGLCRRAYPPHEDQLLVPGIPEAEGGIASVEALMRFREHVARALGRPV